MVETAKIKAGILVGIGTCLLVLLTLCRSEAPKSKIDRAISGLSQLKGLVAAFAVYKEEHADQLPPTIYAMSYDAGDGLRVPRYRDLAEVKEYDWLYFKPPADAPAPPLVMVAMPFAERRAGGVYVRAVMFSDFSVQIIGEAAFQARVLQEQYSRKP